MNQNEKIRVMIADSYKELRDDIHRFLNAENDIAVVGCTFDPAHISPMCKVCRPQVLVMNLRFEGYTNPTIGFTVVQELLREMPDVAVVLYGKILSGETTLQWRRSGAQGFLALPFTSDELLENVRFFAKQFKSFIWPMHVMELVNAAETQSPAPAQEPTPEAP